MSKVVEIKQDSVSLKAPAKLTGINRKGGIAEGERTQNEKTEFTQLEERRADEYSASSSEWYVRTHIKRRHAPLGQKIRRSPRQLAQLEERWLCHANW